MQSQIITRQRFLSQHEKNIQIEANAGIKKKYTSISGTSLIKAPSSYEKNTASQRESLAGADQKYFQASAHQTLKNN